jgi:hypothetical protein
MGQRKSRATSRKREKPSIIRNMLKGVFEPGLSGIPKSTSTLN